MCIRDRLKELAAAGIYPEGDGADFYTSGLKRTEQTLELIYGPVSYTHLDVYKRQLLTKIGKYYKM